MTYSSEVLADSPVVYFRLGDTSGTTATDSSGNARHGTYINTPTLGVTGAIADGDKAVTFTRSQSERVDFPTTGLPSGASPYTLEAWINPVSINPEQGIVGIGAYDTAGGAANALRLEGSSGAPGIKNYWWANDFGVSAPALTTGSWHHIVATWDGTTHRIYHNATLLGSRTPSPPNVIVASPTIGKTYPGNGENFDGSIDEVAIYATALSPTRIAAHYAAATSTTITVTGEKWAAPATMLDGTPRVGLRVTGEAWASAATMLDGTIPVNEPITVTGEAWSTPATVLDGSGRLRVAGESWSAPADFLNGNIVGEPIIATGEAWSAPATMLDGIAFIPPPLNGYGLVLDSTATVSADAPLEPLPTPTGAPSTLLRIVATSVPVPTLVAGRPQ